MQKENHAALSSYHFKRAKTDGLIQVLNEGSYVMAEYSERSGSIKWQRVVMATQREKIEKWLREHYPVQTPNVEVKAEPKKKAAASSAAHATVKTPAPSPAPAAKKAAAKPAPVKAAPVKAAPAKAAPEKKAAKPAAKVPAKATPKAATKKAPPAKKKAKR